MKGLRIVKRFAKSHEISVAYYGELDNCTNSSPFLQQTNSKFARLLVAASLFGLFFAGQPRAAASIASPSQCGDLLAFFCCQKDTQASVI